MRRKRAKIIRIKWQKKIDRSYWRELNDIVDTLFSVADERGFSWTRLADEAQLGEGTVYRLARRITKYPRFQTIWKLGRAVNIEIVLQKPAGKKVAGAKRLAQA